MPDVPAPQPSPAGRIALWSVGFRPFFLCAAVFAAISISAWVAQLAGWAGPHVYVAGPLWHAHEMIFGYVFAVIVGFLFTAVRNWTNLPTPSGPALAFIVALWFAARVLVFAHLPVFAAVADIAFALAAAAGIAVPLFKSRNRRNYFFVALIVALGVVNLYFYLAMAGVHHLALESGLQFGLDLVLLIMVVMGGRVIPMFTANALPGATPRQSGRLERAALWSILALLALELAGAPGLLTGISAGIAAAAHAARLALWQPWLTRKHPILWILHASYAWIVVYLALRVLAAVNLLPDSLAVHALTVGAIGGLTIGMMTRVARGHTGRPLEASVLEVACYTLVQVAAAVRVFLPLLVPQWHLAAVVASGMLWALAFVLFFARFWPILLRPRIDGRTG